MFYMYSTVHQREAQRHVQGARFRDLCPKLEWCITFHRWSELKTIMVNGDGRVSPRSHFLSCPEARTCSFQTVCVDFNGNCRCVGEEKIEISKSH